MMDSRLQKLAMEQMSRMTPEQLAQLRSQMGSISPMAMMRMQEKIAKMPKAELEKVEQKLQNTDPSSLPSVSSTLQVKQAHAYQVSMTLKTDGNDLFRQGNLMAAVEKYERAKSNMSLFLDKQSSDLMMICALNMANCYLKLEMYSQCIAECTEVLKDAPKNVKALYRRGQAYMHQGKNKQALEDLKLTLQLTTSDSEERALIQQKLDCVKEQLEETATSSHSATEEEAKEETPIERVSLENASKGDCVDEDKWRQSAETVAQLTDDEIRQMSQWAGVDVSPDMVRKTQAAMKDTDAETLSRMADLGQKLNAADRQGPKSTTAPPDFGPDSDDYKRMCATFTENPEWIKDQAERMKNLSHEELERLASMGGESVGFKLSPQMVKHAADSISRMDTERLRDLPNLADEYGKRGLEQQTDESSSDGPEPAFRSSGFDKLSSTSGMTPQAMENIGKMVDSMSPNDLARAAKMMTEGDTPLMMNASPSNPEMIQQCMQMLNTMDEDSLVRMISSSGFSKDEEQVSMMVRRLKGMSPAQLKMFATTIGYGQKGVQAAKKIKQIFLSRAVLICAILAIVIGVVLRFYGIL